MFLHSTQQYRCWHVTSGVNFFLHTGHVRSFIGTHLRSKNARLRHAGEQYSLFGFVNGNSFSQILHFFVFIKRFPFISVFLFFCSLSSTGRGGNVLPSPPPVGRGNFRERYVIEIIKEIGRERFLAGNGNVIEIITHFRARSRECSVSGNPGNVIEIITHFQKWKKHAGNVIEIITHFRARFDDISGNFLSCGNSGNVTDIIEHFRKRTIFIETSEIFNFGNIPATVPNPLTFNLIPGMLLKSLHIIGKAFIAIPGMLLKSLHIIGKAQLSFHFAGLLPVKISASS